MNIGKLTARLGLATWLTACVVASQAQTPPAQTQAPPPAAASGTRTITPNFKDVPIETLAEAVGEATGVTFILDPRVRAQVSLINPKAMTPRELYAVFLSILQVNAFAAVPAGGNVVKIVQDVNIRTVPGNDLPTSGNGNGDEIVTNVIEVKNISALQLATVLKQLQPAYGVLQAIPGTNSLVVTDRASNVARIARIVNRVDQASSSANVEVIRLENASAGDVVRTLTALTAGQPADAAAGLAPRMVADERTNSVLISGDPAQRLRIATWIAHLDTPLENGTGTEVIYLKYAEADKLAAKLKEQATGIAAAGAGGTPATAAAGGDRSVTIISDPQTNALVVTAPPKMMRQLRSVVDKLDIPLAQVQVEAIIADVNTDKSADLGINWAVFSNKNDTTTPAAGFISPVGSANGSPVNIVDLTRAVLNPAAATTVPLGTTIGFGRLNNNGINFAAMVRALRADGNTNVIATPTLTAGDNQAAEFKSAQEVPFLSGQYTNTGNTNNGQVNPFTTVQREEVGTILKIKPQINDGNTVTLNIELESSELAGSTGDAGSQITNKRSFKTSVRVDNGAAIVVAGLIRDSKVTGETRVPFLGRIPLIGEAFKVRNGKRSQTNLMVFIRPKILTDGVQAAIETNSKYNLIRQAQLNQGERGEILPILPGDKPPLLPPAPPVPAPATPAAPAPATSAPKSDTTGSAPPAQ